MQLTSRYRFSAAHKLDAAQLTPEENRALYGKCNNPFGHGHDYVIEVTVDGPLDGNGMVANRAELDRIVRDAVVDPLDHTYLNEDIAEFADQVPTTENLAVVIRDRLTRAWTLGARLARVRIIETARNTFALEV